MKPTYQDYLDTTQKIADVGNAIAVLSWDKEVHMPKNGVKFRSQQMATLAGIRHELFVSERFGEILEYLSTAELNEQQAKNVALSLKDYRREKSYSTEFVIRCSKTISETYHAWVAARKANDFGVYRDALTKMIAIKREEAELIGYKDHPYDALLDEYEADCKTADLVVLFADVRKQLVAFVNRIKEKPQVETAFLSRFYPKDKQWAYGLEVLKNMGYDFDSGRQDISHHPFTTNFSPQDVRVTTRVDEHDFANMLWSCIHEGGHALYEQGLLSENYGTPLAAAISLGIHESQSRLWENNIGRSLLYWTANYAGLQATFPENLQDISVTDFYNGVNKIAPNLIRTEADELHYHFHVLIRFELEKALMEGKIEVKDLDKAWNAKYKEYLGVDVPDANHGILQDIHWSHGSLGYFPTYSLGSFYAAQFYQQAVKDIPNLEVNIQAGNTQPLLDWLREHIHQYGRFYTAEELCIKITGEKLNFKYFMDYAEQKYGAIYKLDDSKVTI